MFYNTIISTDELQEHLDDPNLVIIDCRNKDGFANYTKGHIPKVVYADLDKDLSGKVTDESGRHPLPDPAVFKNTLENWGIGNSKQVVVYDNSNGAIASRLWWMLRYFKHKAVAVLDGGFLKWQNENKTIEQSVCKNSPGTFEGDPCLEFAVSLEQTKTFIKNPDYLLIDSRHPKRYSGEDEPIDPIAGHIPGAINHFYENNVDDSGVMLSRKELHQNFKKLLKNIATNQVVFYCGSGVTACQNILAMEYAGFPGTKLFVGSWSQWSKVSQPKKL